MNRLALALALAALPAVANAGEINGSYLEARTCQIYTGPCFANAEINLVGKEAMMAWNIESGSRDGVDLSGLSVVVVVAASDTLADKGVNDPKSIKSAIIVDEKASDEQRAALIAFAKDHAGRGAEKVVRVDSAPIEMSLDTISLTGSLKAGNTVKLVTRKCGQKDCICCNEIAYYPPLAQVTNFAPGVAIEGSYTGRGLGGTWSVPDSRSVYMGTFNYE
jgi:hypothetical protein